MESVIASRRGAGGPKADVAIPYQFVISSVFLFDTPFLFDRNAALRKATLAMTVFYELFLSWLLTLGS